MNPTRRNLLRALGLLGPAYFLPSLRKRGVRAAAPAIPTRILFFYTPHGQLLRQWVAAPAGASAPTETNFALGPSLQPLAPFQSQLTLVEGLDFISEYPDTSQATNGHIGGQTHALSSIGRLGPSIAGGISIDQLIANGINSPTPVTQLPSLQLSARYNGGIAPFLTSWAGANSLVAPQTDPAAVYTSMFPNGASSTNGAAQAAAAALARRRQSVLDAVLGEFAAVKAPLSAADQTKLDSQATLIRSLETQLKLSSSVTCAPPNQASVTSAYKADCPYGAGDLCIQDAVTAFTSLAVAALACDITRVITLDVDTLPDAIFSANPNVPAAGGIHGFLHGMDDSDWFSNDRFGTKNSISTGAEDATNIQTATSFYAMYAQMLANLLQQLAAVPEPDGTTLLDHTIVVWCSEFGSPNHIYSVVDYLLAGGGAAGLTPGRYLSIPRVPQAYKSADYYVNNGVPHSNLFVSLANLMGLGGVTTFGNPKTCTGPLTQLTSA